jgi:hypothetical protein
MHGRAGLFGRDIALWSEPLIADYVYTAYERCLDGQNEIAALLTQQHCRVWRALLDGEPIMARFLRQELLKALARLKLNNETLDAIDVGVCDELLEVIMRRSQRSRASARSDGMALVQAASMLGEIRNVA